VGRKWRNFGCASLESRTVGGDLDENCFTLTRTAIDGVEWWPFLVKREIPGDVQDSTNTYPGPLPSTASQTNRGILP
jgi:hypothetical protein